MKLTKLINKKEGTMSQIQDNTKSPYQHEFRTAMLYGDITEEKSENIIKDLLYLYETSEIVNFTQGTRKELLNSLNPFAKKEEDYQILTRPIDFTISSFGGNAHDMFSIYDSMRYIQENGVEIHTLGLGKVMSAGVLILAAGTKGKRKVGKHCRIMIHSVSAGIHGSEHILETETKEILSVGERMVDALVEETSMSRKELKEMLNSKINTYLSAEEAVRYGIVDIIV